MKLSYSTIISISSSLRYAIGLLVVFLICQSFKASSQDTLSLNECIKFSLKHNKQSTIYQNNSTIAAEKVREYKAKLLPSISGSANLDYNPKLQVTIIPPGPFGDEETEFVMGNKFVSGGTIDVEQVILNKAYILDIKSGRVDKTIADLQSQKENETLIYNTAQAYYDVLTYLEKRKLLLDNEQRNLLLEKIVDLRYKQGVAKKSDYDRSVVNRKNIQSDLAQNDTEYIKALNNLKNAMGMNLNTPIAIKEITSYKQDNKPNIETQINLENRLDYKIDQNKILQKNIAVKYKKAAYWPTLSAYATYGANAYGDKLQDTFGRIFSYNFIGVKLSVPIFSGFEKNSILNQSILEAKNQKLTQELNLESYELEYKNSQTELNSSNLSLQKDKETMELAKSLLDATSLEYQNGEATYSTLLDDEFSYKEARSNYITSFLNFLNAQLTFEKAKGTLGTYLKINEIN